VVTSQAAVSSTRLHEQSAIGTCRLYLVRHGTTTLNVQNRYRGRRDIPLDATGYQDAMDAASSLSHERLSAVYTGPLRRAIAAAQIIADEARVPDLRILHGLNNVDYGAWEGMTAQEAATFDPEAFEVYRTSPGKAACPLGERLIDAQQRMIDAIQLISSRHSGEAVAAVTHAVMIRLLMVHLTGAEDERWRRPVGSGPVTEFQVRNGAIEPAQPLADSLGLTR
jgi:broad specificity phosphatase PhoE